MDLIRLYSNSIDINPNALLKHFLRFLGFYVDEKLEDDDKDEIDSVADIYIISSAFVDKCSSFLENIDKNKTILILKDGYHSDDDVKQLLYNDESEFIQTFLMNLTEEIADIIHKNKRRKALLLQKSDDWKRSAQFVAKQYAQNKLLKASLFTRCFYEHNKFYKWGINRYQRFIEKVREYAYVNDRLYSDYLSYVLLYSKYEANLISKKNSYKYQYDTEELLGQCNKLLQKYNENEELHLLRADIIFELNDNWMDGCDLYADKEVSHCSYAYFKSGKIFKNYYKDYGNAIILLKHALSKNLHYFQAWYQLGDCYEHQGLYSKSIESFENVRKVLNTKLKKKLLAPIEMEYIYKAIMKIAVIYKVRLGDYQSAYAYSELASEIREKSVITNYVDIEWGKEDDIEDAVNEIDKAVKAHTDVKLDQIY